MSNLEQKIKELNKEVLRLKTAHPVAATMITFYGEYPCAFLDDRNHVYEITYVGGTQPIMTFDAHSLNFLGELLFGEPVGNKQYIYAIGEYLAEETTFALFSTRQILSVRPIS